VLLPDFSQDMVTKDDPELKFDDDVDDNVLAAMVPDPVTNPRSNPSCATSTATANPVLRGRLHELGWLG